MTQRWSRSRTDARARLGPADRSSTDVAPEGPSDSFVILGRQLDSWPCTPALRAWLERHWRYDEHAVGQSRYRIRLTERAVPPEGAGADDVGSIDVRLPGNITLRWNARDGEWHTGDGAAGVRARFDAEKSRIAVWGATDPGARATAQAPAAAAAPWPALYVAFCEAMRASGLVPLHAAVVVRGDDAIALTGPSGTGKTTTLLRLLERGWRPLAEDFSWLDPASCTLYGWDRGLRLWPDGLARLGPRIAAAPWIVDRDGKRLLAWSAVPAARVPQATLTRIVLLERDATRPSSITRLSRQAAVRVLWEATGVPLTPWVRENAAQHIARLAQTLELTGLTLGARDLPEPDAVIG